MNIAIKNVFNLRNLRMFTKGKDAIYCFAGHFRRFGHRNHDTEFLQRVKKNGKWQSVGSISAAHSSSGIHPAKRRLGA